MLKYKVFTVLIYFHTLFCGCSGKEQTDSGFTEINSGYKIKRIGMLAEAVPESSGLALSHDNFIWTHNDAGHGSHLIKVNLDGELQEIIEIEGTKNKDWEDLAKDTNGNLYIGDFGNNENKRKNLRIYKVSEHNMMVTDTITFTYPDQAEFPPEKENRNFDCEAFFWHNNHLYLFSKNRGKGRYTKMYKLPDTRGNYTAELIDSVEANTMITGADISPSGKQFALLGYGFLYLIELNDKVDFNGRKSCIPFGKSGQAEGIAYLNNSEIIFTNEGGKIFKITLE